MSALAPFHPTIRAWFESRLGEPTAPQREGWPAIGEGRHTLIAAPTGSGKTLAAFLAGLDALVSQKDGLPDETRLLYVSPLRALSNDVQKNLQAPLAEIRALDPSVPEVRVLVRTGDTTSAERAAMVRRPPHILVTTPESLAPRRCSTSSTSSAAPEGSPAGGFTPASAIHDSRSSRGANAIGVRRIAVAPSPQNRPHASSPDTVN